MSSLDLSIYNASEPKVTAGVCPKCGALHYPTPMICKKCGARRDPSGLLHDEWEQVELSGECTLLTWTRVYALPEGYDSQYMDFCVVEFPNGLRASGRLFSDAPKTGMKLNARGMRTDEGTSAERIVFRFDGP